MNTPLLALSLLVCCCMLCNDPQPAAPNTIVIKNASEEYKTMMYLGKEYWYWGMDIEENTLNDTAMIGVMKIPPGKTGRLFRVECFTDSIPFSYKPYKARKGRLTIRYFAFMNADNRLP